MAFKNRLYRPFLTSNKKYYHKHYQQIIFRKLTRWKYMFCLICGIALFVIYSVIQFQNLLDRLNRSRCISYCSPIPEREPDVSIVSTGPGVPPVTVGLYYLPSNEPNITKHRALKEYAHGTKDNFGYPVGAELLSKKSEYTIPSDRISDKNGTCEFKYFHEMKGYNHMDARFGKRRYAGLSDMKRVAILRDLFAAWSRFTDEKQIPSWIAHGTLLSWWWGNSFFPWDSDIDVQMNANFLYVLERFNRTVVGGRYLIDVNPHFRVRHRQKHNYIDARMIDKHTGYFIDISGMADTGLRIASNPKKLLLCDKHRHRTFYSDLHPLVRIEFEGIATWRPYNAEYCLIKEYGSKALVQTVYRRYKYDVNKATWIRNKGKTFDLNQLKLKNKSNQSIQLTHFPVGQSRLKSVLDEMKS